MTPTPLPADIEKIRSIAMRVIQPIRPANEQTHADAKFLFNAQRTKAGRSLQEYYLVYFLLVKLLGFRDLGQFEKVAWSIPIDFNGKAFLIEYRKSGVGVFAHNAETEETEAQQIVALIQKGLKVAEPFFDWLAERAVEKSELNVINRSDLLYERYEYFLGLYKAEINRVASGPSSEGEVSRENIMNTYRATRDKKWLALAAIDSFFSWTEHVFIHLAIIQGKITTGTEVADLAKADWEEKFKKSVGLDEPQIKPLYDDLLHIRRQLRNFMAHGAFGKRGEAFHFHSSTGAVPVFMPYQKGHQRYALSSQFGFDDCATIKIIENFIELLWYGDREPARLYIMESGMPIILTSAGDGTYKEAMQSIENMQKHIDITSYVFDQAANMDW
ncbi:MAG: hypothetical protein LWW87_10360 [Geobacteraceae bacterium]|nr:hypothetical protein [Geobacteraceae bacterium]